MVHEKANQNKTKNKKQHQKPDDPQIPQPDLRFAAKTAKQKKTGQGPNKTPTTRFAIVHSDICHRAPLKNMQKLIIHCGN